MLWRLIRSPMDPSMSGEGLPARSWTFEAVRQARPGPVDLVTVAALARPRERSGAVAWHGRCFESAHVARSPGAITGSPAAIHPRQENPMRLGSISFLMLVAVLAGAAPARADIAPPDACTSPGQPCSNVMTLASGTCTTATCSRVVPDGDGGTTTMSYTCMRCVPTD